MSDEAGQNRYCRECGLELPATATAEVCSSCRLYMASRGNVEFSEPTLALRLPPGWQSPFFDDYEVLELLAQGGMGVVYKARQIKLKRLVALKTIQSWHLLSPEARMRFEVEIEAAAQLDHPHIVPLYDSGEHQGVHFFTMKLVEGGNLSAHLKAGFPLREFVLLLIKVCHAVHYAHQRGIIHRDLKPSNILVNESGEPHVADFGLAKSLDQDTVVTFSSAVLGSPNYMAPEQASTQSKQLTTAVDVYGLGAILYERLAGRPPFQAPTPLETMRLVVDADPTPPRRFQSSRWMRVDPDLEIICLKCLNKTPSARYGTAEDLAQDLERWCQGLPIRARSMSGREIAWRWTKRHPVAAGLAMALMLALLAIVAGVSYSAWYINQVDQRATANLRQSMVSQARVLRMSGHLGRKEEGLALLQEALSMGRTKELVEEIRGEALALMARTDIAFVPFPAQAARADLHLTLLNPDFTTLAQVLDGTNLAVRSTADGALQRQWPLAGGAVKRLETFSPNGRFVAARQEEGFSVWDIETGDRTVWNADPDILYCFATHADSVLVQVAPCEVATYDLASGSELSRVDFRKGRDHVKHVFHRMSLSPDGAMLAASVSGYASMEINDAVTGGRIKNLYHQAYTATIAWSRESHRLAVGTSEGKIYVWDVREGPMISAFPAMLPSARKLAFDPTGAMLAVSGSENRVRLLDVPNARLIYEFPGAGPMIDFDAQGLRLGPVESAGEVGWLQLVSPREFREYRMGEIPFDHTGGHYSPDGRFFISGNLTNAVFSDPVTGKVYSTIKGTQVNAAVFHPVDGSLFMAGSPGLFRFEVAMTSSGRLRFNSKVLLHKGLGWVAFDFNRDGSRLAAVNINRETAYVFDETQTNVVARLRPHPHATFIDLSPDGRWAATGSFQDGEIRLWNVPQEKMLWAAKVGPMPRAVFSNDGRWLATYGEKFELREVGTWKPAPPLPLPEKKPALGAAAFSSDGRILAVVGNYSEVHLFDMQTFQALGILRPPLMIHISGLAFSPDNTHLAAVGDSARVALWDLREVRRTLSRYDLDWPLPTL